MQMETKEVLAIATVPWQKWGPLYEDEQGFKNGTIFCELNKPFFAAEEVTQNIGSCCQKADAVQQDREQLMTRIQQVSFCINDLTLYLDTHGNDKEALSVFTEKVRERTALLEEFVRKYYPLTCDCIAKCENSEIENLWAKGPMPWEGACV